MHLEGGFTIETLLVDDCGTMLFVSYYRTFVKAVANRIPRERAYAKPMLG